MCTSTCCIQVLPQCVLQCENSPAPVWPGWRASASCCVHLLLTVCAFCSNLPPAKPHNGSDDIIAHIHISPAGGRRIRAANYLSPWWGGLREWRLVCDSAAGADWHLGCDGKAVTTPLVFGNENGNTSVWQPTFNGDNSKPLEKLLILY